MKQALPYHLARGIGYATIGAVAGAGGRSIYGAFSGRPEWEVFVVIFFMGTLGLQSYHLWNGTGDASWTTGLMRVLLRRPSSSGREVRMRPGPFLYGLLTVLVPCGWIAYFGWIAAATGSATIGAGVFVALWLGSLPALLAAAAAWSTFRRRFPGAAFRKISAVTLLLVSIFSIIPRIEAFERTDNRGDLSHLCNAFPIGSSSPKRVDGLAQEPK